MIRRALYTLRYMRHLERARLVSRLALAMECGVLTWKEAFASYRREVPWWSLIPDRETQPLIEAQAPKEQRVNHR
jgi:hypothetical protein